MAGFRLAPSRHTRWFLLLLASLWFYASWNPRYLLVLAVPILVTYSCAIRIEQSTDAAARKCWLATGVVSNLILLAYFKYANFFLANVSLLFGTSPKYLDIALPLGISFFTLKSLSYTIDVYRADQPACRSFWRYATFICYFPDLIAGPIIRASAFFPQTKRTLRPSWSRVAVGGQMILLGFTKKLLIADQLAIFVDPVFAEPGTYSPLTVWSAVVAYSLQIYCDFSGYSDMATGISKIVGIDLPENFNMPYLALSPLDFWRRWHITLSNWLRDYLYFSLPVRRTRPLDRYRNAAVTFLLSGLWHGASWTFVCWGARHGLGFGVTRGWSARRQRLGRSPSQSIRVRFAAWLATYIFICLTWVLFRSRNFSIAVTIILKLTGVAQGGIAWLYSPLLLILPIVIAGHAIGVKAARIAGAGGRPTNFHIPGRVAALDVQCRESLEIRYSRYWGAYVLLLPDVLGSFLISAWVLTLLLFSATGANPFVYFQF
jgi:alginate O-acetyltransferase complex protein AlgI